MMLFNIISRVSVTDFTDMMPVVTEILNQDMSINLYMFHGGTNFGFMSGAFAVGLPAPKPMVTSYGMCNESVYDLLYRGQ